METKIRFRDVGGAEGFSKAVLSGVIANWLVGMAAFLATMGRTVIGKYASLGAIRVGMLKALDAEGIRPDMVNGTSVGAVDARDLLAGEALESLA